MLTGTRDLPRAALAQRRAALAAALAQRKVEAAVLVAGLPRPRNYPANAYPFRPHSHFLYFVGWGAPGAVVLFAGGEATVFVPPADPEDALWSGPSPAPADLAAALGLAVRPLPDFLDRAGRLGAAAMATLPAPDSESRAAQEVLLGRPLAPGRLDPVDEPLADAVIALRLRHDDAAVADLRLAADLTGHAHRAGLRATAPGRRESFVQAAMEAVLTARGSGTAYPSIVTVHGHILHNEAHDQVLAEEDLLLADVGAESPGGFAGDVTRTWPVGGRFSPDQADLYDVVLGAQRAAIGAVAPGVRYRDVHLAATRALAEGLVALGILHGDPAERAGDGSVALLFPHGVGHLLGLDVHDMEDLGDRAGYAPGRSRSADPGLRYLRLDRDLQEGMAVTIEPGLYFVPGLIDDPERRRAAAGRVDWTRVDRYRRARGIRIEDDVLVTATGAEVLTAAIPKDRAAIEAELAGADSRPVTG